jgi:AraC-like DNA-binding protein
VEGIRRTGKFPSDYEKVQGSKDECKKTASAERKLGQDDPGSKLRRENNGNKNRMVGVYRQCVGNGRILFGRITDFLKLPSLLETLNMNRQSSTQKPPSSKKKIEWLILDSGLELAIEDFKPLENLYINLEVERPPLELYFCLSGKMRRIDQGGENKMVVSAGQVALWFSPELKSKVEYPAGDPIRWVVIRLDSRLLKILPESKPEQIPAFLRGFLFEGKRGFYSYQKKMTASMRMSVYQILNCPYRGFIRKLYLEGKALELLAYAGEDMHSKKLSALRPEEQERVHRAREILVHNLENPPSLLELSRKVGLNDYKLKIGFRQIFGTTAFGYLRRERLEEARRLLEEGKMSVTEVSYSVGYSSLSHFARVFARRFGIKPGSYLAEIRRR